MMLILFKCKLSKIVEASSYAMLNTLHQVLSRDRTEDILRNTQRPGAHHVAKVLTTKEAKNSPPTSAVDDFAIFR